MATEGNAPDGEAPDAEMDRDALLRARWLFAQRIAFELGAPSPQHLPEPDRPEVAFAGRSNVGKSSLLNALCGQSGLARTSNTPGRTREINFFTAEAGLRLVDLPGYGYARAPKQAIRQWQRTLFDYLRGRANLRRVFLLIDARHGLKTADTEAMTVLDEAAVSFQVVLTKADKLKPAARDAARTGVAREARRFTCCHPDTLATSSHSGTGLDQLRLEISALADWRLIDYPTRHTGGDEHNRQTGP